MYIFAAVLLCVILPSQVAFTSLVSAGGVPTIAAYALISGLRLFCTPDGFKSTKFNLGVFRRPFYLVGLVFNLFILGVCRNHSGPILFGQQFQVDLSPFFFPVTVDTFNFVSSKCILVSYDC
jgi:translation initiation factor 5B